MDILVSKHAAAGSREKTHDPHIIPETFRKRVTDSATNSSERQALDVIRREPHITRADIGRRIGLTGMSMTRIIDGLEQRGFVRSIGRTGGGRGPKIGLELIPDAAYSIGVSIKADELSFLMVDFAGSKVCQSSGIVGQGDARLTITSLATQIAAFIAETGIAQGKIFGVGVAVTGFFIGRNAQVNPPAQLDALALTDIDGPLAQALGLPVWVDNDGNAAAQAEAMLGVGRWASNFAYLYFATGFGGGIIHQGRLLRGRNGNAGEFAGIIPLSGFMHPNLENLRLLHNAQGERFSSVTHMLACFDPSWPAIDQWLEKTAPALNLVTSAASAVLDPDAIVFGGQLPKALAQRMIGQIEFTSVPRRGLTRPVPVVVHAEVIEEPALLGAAAIPLRTHFFT